MAAVSRRLAAAAICSEAAACQVLSPSIEGANVSNAGSSPSVSSNPGSAAATAANVASASVRDLGASTLAVSVVWALWALWVLVVSLVDICLYLSGSRE